MPRGLLYWGERVRKSRYYLRFVKIFPWVLPSNAWGPVNVNADWNVLVANGKTLNVYGALNSSGRTITVGGEGFSGTLVLNNAANASMTAEWVITSGSTVRCMNNSALGSGLVTLDGGRLILTRKRSDQPLR